MGRQSAGNGFLRGFAGAFNNEAGGKELPVITRNAKEAQAVEEELRATGWKGAVRHQPAAQPNAWTGFDLLYYASPVTGSLAWQRARRGAGAWSLCGVTHTISSDSVMTQIADCLREPFAPWDALICTSHSVLAAVHRVWAVERENLARRFGVDVSNAPVPMTPVIPLGIHPQDFAGSPEARARVRAAWQMEEDEVAVLYVGRFSMHAKANPWPMYLAVARAAQRSGKRVRFVECGHFTHPETQQVFHDEAAAASGVRLLRLDGKQPGATVQAYAGADIFITLSDNIQESFGLTPLEAMAAGLPVVASDWDGYRDTVRDGVDGFLVPTRQPGSAAAASMAIHGYEDRWLSYDQYVARAHALVGVDVEAAAQALERLIADAALRRRMGDAGRERVRTTYDWQHVFNRYKALWAEQDARRRHAIADPSAAGATLLAPMRNPRFMNPLDMFAAHASGAITGGTRLLRDTAPGVPAVDQLRNMKMWHFTQGWLPDPAFLLNAVNLLPEQGEGSSVAGWAAQIKVSIPQAERIAAWLHKVGVVRVEG